MSRMVIFALAAGLSLQVAPQPTQPAPAPQAAVTDSDFIMKAAEAGMKEVEAARLAAESTSNADVKAYARRLVVDHSITNEELLKLSRSKNVALTVALKTDPTDLLKAAQPNAAAPEAVASDRAFIDQMVTDHQAAIDLFKREADDGNDPEVKDWAEKKIPTLKEHLKLAKELQEKFSR